MRTFTCNVPGGSAVILYDGNKHPLPDACNDAFLPKAVSVTQISDLFRSAFKFMAGRNNLLVRIDQTVTHTFPSAMQCQDFIGNRATVLPAGIFELMILTRAESNSWIRYYKQCLLTQNECVENIGRTCRFRYSLLVNSPYSITP